MKAFIEIVELKNDIITTSTVACEYEACPGLQFDPYALEG